MSVKIVALLAFAQAFAATLRALGWVQVGIDLFGQGLLLLPLVGAVAVLRGLLISGVALFYLLFAVGALLEKRWSRWVGLTAAIVNLVLVLGALARGTSIAEALAWAVIPTILVIYLLSASERKAIAL